MACCVLIMAFIAQLFAIRRRVRQALGLPVGDWYDDEPQPGFRAVWGAKLRSAVQSTGVRAALVTVAVAEITFIALAAPGAQGLVAQHRRHVREAWEYVASFGTYTDVASLWCATTTPARTSAPRPAP